MKAVVIAGVLASTTAHAEPKDVIATQPLALVARGIAVSYEHRIADRWSAQGFTGFRAAALEDYNSRTVVIGGELRFWLRARTPMRGPFFALHASIGYTRLADDVMGRVGASTALTQRVDFGWRFTIRNKVALGPTLGLGTREDIDSGPLATTIRPSLAIGFELGWIR